MPWAAPVHGQRERLARKAQSARAYDQQRGNSAERGYGSQWRRLAAWVRARDCYLCQECGRPAGKSAHVDHIVAKAKGGTDDPDNLRVLCHACHSRRTVRDDGGFGHALR